LDLITKELFYLLIFQFVEVESSKIKKTSDEAKKPQNKALNRYQDVSPYDETRIILKRGNVSYINANLVQVRIRFIENNFNLSINYYLKMVYLVFNSIHLVFFSTG